MAFFSKDTSLAEKAAILFPVLLIAFLYASAFGVFHNFYSVAVAAAKPHGFWFALGLAFTAGWIYQVIKNVHAGVKGFGSTILIAVFLVLALLSFCGFAYPYVF